jgi:PAS domain S-box-containing protein
MSSLDLPANHTENPGLLQESVNLEMLFQVLEAMTDGVWVCNADAYLIWVNSACEQLNDIKRDEVCGKTVDQLQGQGNYDRDVTHQVLRTGKPKAIIQKVRSGRTLLVHGVPVFDARGEVSLVVGTERDLTELNALREQIDRSRGIQEKIQSELTALSIDRFGSRGLVANSDVMQRILDTCVRVAHFDSTVLLTGETGTGKSVIAGFIHKTSDRNAKPFLSLNCGAIPEGLIEAELFGYAEGAFSGSRKGGKPGLIEAADGGTLLLDEVDSFSMDLQVKLLTFLDTQSFIRVGDTRVREVNVRLIVATNQDLAERVEHGAFRSDLLYRLNVLPIELPPLRDRMGDLPGLAQLVLQRLSDRYGQTRTLSRDALDVLCRYHYPGNIRELENILERVFVMAADERIQVDDLPGYLAEGLYITHGNPSEQSFHTALKQLEYQYLKAACEKHGRQVDIARELGVSQPTVARLMKKHALAIARDSIQD